MTELLEKAMKAAETLSPQDQDEVAGVMLEMIEQRQHGSLLTEEQQAEVLRRLANPNRVLIPMEEVFTRLDRLRQDHEDRL